MLERNNIQYRNLEEQVGYNTALLNLVPVGFNTDNFKGIVAPGSTNTIAAGQFALVGLTAPYSLYYNDSTKGLVNLGEFPRVGPQGRDGFTGPAGEKGEAGPGWLTGATIPETIAQEGQLYFRYTTSDIYEYHGNRWILIANIRGQVGPTGKQGPQGEVGQRGPQGPQGQQGRPGASYAIVGWLAYADELPQPAEDYTGDAYLVSTGLGTHVYISFGGNWVDSGSVVAQQIEVVNTKGDSDTNVMSQAATTRELNALSAEVSTKISYPLSFPVIPQLGYSGDLTKFAYKAVRGYNLEANGELVRDGDFDTYFVYFGKSYKWGDFCDILAFHTTGRIFADDILLNEEFLDNDQYTGFLPISAIADTFDVLAFSIDADGGYCEINPSRVGRINDSSIGSFILPNFSRNKLTHSWSSYSHSLESGSIPNLYNIADQYSITVALDTTGSLPENIQDPIFSFSMGNSTDNQYFNINIFLDTTYPGTDKPFVISIDLYDSYNGDQNYSYYTHSRWYTPSIFRFDVSRDSNYTISINEINSYSYTIRYTESTDLTFGQYTPENYIINSVNSYIPCQVFFTYPESTKAILSSTIGAGPDASELHNLPANIANLYVKTSNQTEALSNYLKSVPTIKSICYIPENVASIPFSHLQELGYVCQSLGITLYAVVPSGYSVPNDTPIIPIYNNGWTANTITFANLLPFIFS